MRLLKTNCEHCIFHQSDGCNIYKSTYIEKNHQFCEGFCRQKRHIDFVQDNLSTLQTLSVINKEEKKITLIINAIDQNYDKLYEFLDNFPKGGYNSFINQVIVRTYQANDEQIKTIYTKINTESLTANIVNVLIEHGNNLSIDSVVDRVENHWFFDVSSNQELNKDLVGKIKGIFNNTNNNFGILETKAGKIYSKAVFTEFDMNNELPIEEKVKTFDNWRLIWQIL